MPQAPTMTERQVDELLADDTIPIAHRALWALLWEGELRLGDALSLDVRDLDLAAGTARVEYGKRSAPGPVSVPLGERAVALLHQAVSGHTDGPALHTGGQPIGREAAARRARSAGAASIHAFRTGGQAHRGIPR